MEDMTLRSRIKVACLAYADYIIGEAASVAAHNTRLRWAQATFQAPDVAAAAITPLAVMDPAIQASTQPSAADVTDATLLSVVETAINNTL